MKFLFELGFRFNIDWSDSLLGGASIIRGKEIKKEKRLAAPSPARTCEVPACSKRAREFLPVKSPEGRQRLYSTEVENRVEYLKGMFTPFLANDSKA